MLATHPDIHSVSEPWVMLHPLYALRPGGERGEYDAPVARGAVEVFLRGLPGGEADYWEGVRRMAVYVYERARQVSGKRYFLDKTPRYYLVLRELHRVLPGARYLILFRNPLATFTSIVRTWIGEEWYRLAEHRADLVRAPRLLVEGREALGEQALTLRYIDLVRDPEGETRRICRWLDVPYAPEMVAYGRRPQPSWRFGDQQRVYEHDGPVPQYVEDWQEAAAGDPQLWRLLSEYLELLGPGLVAGMGCDHAELRRTLDRRRPPGARAWTTCGLAWLLEGGERGPTAWRRGVIRLKSAVRRRGMAGAGARALRQVVGAAGREPAG
jgi:hypothetical protein